MWPAISTFTAVAINALITTNTKKCKKIFSNNWRSRMLPMISAPSRYPKSPNNAPEAPALGTKTLNNKLAIPAEIPQKKYSSKNRVVPMAGSSCLPNTYRAYMFTSRCTAPKWRNIEVIILQGWPPNVRGFRLAPAWIMANTSMLLSIIRLCCWKANHPKTIRFIAIKMWVDKTDFGIGQECVFDSEPQGSPLCFNVKLLMSFEFRFVAAGLRKKT